MGLSQRISCTCHLTTFLEVFKTVKLKSLLIANLLLSFMLLMPACADEFTQFRGPGGAGVVRDQAIPSSWSGESNLAWKVSVPGSGWSQPVVWQNKLFVTSAVGDKEFRPKDFNDGVKTPQSMGLGGLSAPPKINFQWQVHCYDVAQGSLLWSKTVVEGRPEFPIHPSNSYATESPVVDAQGVYVLFGATGTVAGLSHAGDLIWKKELGAFPTNNGFGTGSSLAIFEDAVFAQHFTEKSASLTCFETSTGNVKWTDNRDEMGSSWSSPIVWNNSVRPELISSGGEKLISYSPKTGEKLWMVSNIKAPTACSVASDSERIYFGGSDPMSKGPLFAVHAGASGDLSPKKKNDSLSFCDWLEKKAAPGMASPVSTGINVVVLDNNILRAYDAKTGKKVQERRLGQLKMIAASPLVVDGKVLVLDEEGNAVLLDSAQEYSVVGNGKIDDTFWSTPAIANNSIYLRGINGMYCIRTTPSP